MCKKLIYLAVFLLMLAISVSVQAAVFSDDFETPRDYLTDSLEGIGWDGFIGLGLDETANALNASIDRPGELYLESVESFWWPPFTTLGPFLYKEVEGDFIATVRVTDYADVAYNNIGLMARVGDPDLAGGGEDWISIDYFPIYSVGNIARYCNDDTRTEDGGGNGTAWDAPTYLRLTREGNTFRLWTSLDGSVWEEYPDPAFSPLERPDLDGLPLQVGIHHATGTENTGFGAFDNFSIEGPLVVPPGEAYNPNPSEETVDVPRDSDLIWTPATTAVAHDVYFGTDLNNVSDASRTNPLDVLASQGQNSTTYDLPGRLEFGQTYYWRIDEVEADSTIRTGFIWSFTTEPIAYTIENVTATASSSGPGQGPENTINSSGLDADDLHSTTLEAMWLSDAAGPQPTWIQYEFDKTYKLYEMLVWNHNGLMEPMIGVGFKDVSIEYSVNGTDYTTLGTTHEFARGTGSAAYGHNTTVDFGGASAKFVRLTSNSNWAGFLPQYGLSEVRFLYIPVQAREPSPDSGATDVAIDATLGFRAGREAAEHDVYLSTDEQAVIDGTAPVTTVTENSYSTSLDVDSTYYWRVDEVNDAETPTTWQGDIWNFTTPEFLVVDDFELYNDLDPGDPESNRIFNTWIDGYGITTNGSLVGYDVAPFAEQGIVSGGSQSMPFFYDNSTASYSEATANVADLQVDQDWTKGGAETLVLWIRGGLSNSAAGQLYVKINGTKVMDGGDLSVPLWKQWNIELASLGINLSSITTVSIGVDGGGSGKLYVDDIVLYRIAPPVVEPPPGGDQSLVGHWKLDETSGLTASDSSGYGNDGTLMNMTGDEWTAGIRDGALVFDGNAQIVDCGNAKSLQLSGEGTISAWVKMEPGNEDVYMGIGGKLVSGPYNGFALVRHSSNVFRMWMGNDGGDLSSASSDVTYNDTDWHHVVGVISNNTGSLYVDGVKQVEESACGLVDTGDYAYIGKQYSNGTDRYWVGTIDDFRMYYRALSAQEISGL